MKATRNGDKNMNKTRLESPNESTADDLNFAFFSTDNSQVNAGIGINIDPNHKFEPIKTKVPTVPPIVQTVPEHEKKEDAHPTNKVAKPIPIDAAAEIEEETPVGLSIFTDEDIETQHTESETENVKEKSEKLFADMRSVMDNRRINVDKTDLRATSQPQSSLIIEDNVEADPLSLNIEKLEEDYKDRSTPVKQSIVEVDKVTAADRAGKAINWLTNTFIVAPVKGLFKAIYYHGILNLFSFLGGVLKFLLIAIVLTTIASVWYVHRIDPSIPVTAIPLQTYTVIKDLVVATYKDVSDVVRGIVGK